MTTQRVPSKVMTVAELIAVLQTCPQNASVQLATEDRHYDEPATFVRVEGEGDYALVCIAGEHGGWAHGWGSY